MQGYQRLEFLGDAVLDLLMTRYFFTTYRSALHAYLFLDYSNLSGYNQLQNFFIN